MKFSLHHQFWPSQLAALAVALSDPIRSPTKASLRQAAESVMTNDLESVVKRRFYTFRCNQGPCKAATSKMIKT